MMDVELTAEEREMVLGYRRATAAKARDDADIYAIVRRQSLEDGMVEVEPGHFVRPGEPWTGEDGVFHRNALTPAHAPIG